MDTGAKLIVTVFIGVSILLPHQVDAAQPPTDNASKLLDLAKERFGDLTKAEQALFVTSAIGKVADLRGPTKKDNDPNNADKWPESRSIRAECIEWLCTDLKAVDLVNDKGITIKGVRIDGELDLMFAKINFPLYFENSAFPQVICLLYAEIPALSLITTHTSRIVADGLKVKGSVFLRNGFKAEGEVRLVAATIGGHFGCNNSQFINREGYAIRAGQLNVGGNVRFSGGFRAEGEVQLVNARIAGNLQCDHSWFINPNGDTFNADGLNVDGTVFLRDGFKSEGEVRLLGATIGGGLSCAKARFINPGKRCFNAGGLNVGSGIFLSDGFEANGEVSIKSARIGGNIECRGGRFTNPKGKALDGGGLKVEGNVFLHEGFMSNGEVFLAGATIDGQLDCGDGKFINPKGRAIIADGIAVKGDVFLVGDFKAQGEVRLLGATIGGQLSCVGGEFINPNGYALNAQNITVMEDVFLNEGFNAKGEVNIFASSIGGRLNCNGGQFINPVGYALNAQRIVTKGSALFYSGFRAEGEVTLAGGTVGGNLECREGQFTNKGKRALNAELLMVIGSVSLSHGFEAIGEVRLAGATIAEQLNCSNAYFANPGGYALVCENLKVKNVLMRDGFKSEGIVSFAHTKVDGHFVWTGVDSPEGVILDLRAAKIGTLWDEPESWPRNENLFLDGLVYNKIHSDAPMNAWRRIDWLHRQPRNRFRPQPYIQLAEVLRLAGYNAEAKKILIAMEQEKVQLTEMSTFEKGWYWVFGHVLDYGHHLWKAFWWALLWILGGSLLFGVGKQFGFIAPSQEWAYENHCNVKKVYPSLNCFWYSTDLFLPIIDLHQVKYWLPTSNLVWKDSKIRWCIGKFLRGYFWIHILAGWILTTLLVVGLTGLVRT
jgi:predicted acyltransferase (DUF342 family)